MKKYLFLLLALITAITPFSVVTFAGSDNIGADTQEWEVLKLVNKERIANGLQPLSMDSELQKICDKRETELITNFSHFLPDNTSAYTPKLEDANYAWTYSAENIARGYTNAEDVFSGWMNSTGHKKNILSASSTHIGIGFENENLNWVQIFAGTCIIDNIYIESDSISTYTAGTRISDFSDYIVLECEKHGKTYMPIDESMCSGYDPYKIGKQTVTVTYNAVKSLGERTVIQDSMIWCTYKGEEIIFEPMTVSFDITVIPTTLPPEFSSEEDSCAETEVTSEEISTLPETEATTENISETESESEKEPETVYLDPVNLPADITVGNAFFVMSAYFDGLKSLEIYNGSGELIKDASVLAGTGFEFRCTLTDGTKAIFRTIITGDVNGDGKITAADARTVLRHSASLESLEDLFSAAAEITKDSKITAADARKILRVSAGLEEI